MALETVLQEVCRDRRTGGTPLGRFVQVSVILDQAGGEFDVVFSDVVMPGMNGIELAKEIRRLYPDLSVILASGYSHVLAQSGSSGFQLLHKPYSTEQLPRILRKAASWRRHKRIVNRDS